MRKNKLELYIHFIWTTWDRHPWIIDTVERRLYREIESEAQQCGCTMVAINGTADHVHVLLKLGTTCAIADLVKNMKGASSRFYNAELKPTTHFQWQPNYGAFTVSEAEVEIVKAYIYHQKAHHAQHRLIAAYEESYLEFFREDQ